MKGIEVKNTIVDWNCVMKLNLVNDLANLFMHKTLEHFSTYKLSGVILLIPYLSHLLQLYMEMMQITI